MALHVSVLLDNRKSLNANKSVVAKAGLSFFIRDEQCSVLFDTGPDNTFIGNADLMGVDLSDVCAVVISHGHYDHCGGVSWLPRKNRIICHPTIKSERHASINFLGHRWMVKKLSANVDYSHHNMEYSSKPIYISERFLWSGEIPVSDAKQYGIIIDNNIVPDYMIDEGALIYKSDLALVIFIGCGHRGIINIVNHCKKITGENRIHAIIGGLHLRSAPFREILAIRKYLKVIKPDIVMGCHCTGSWGRFWLPGWSPATGDEFTIG